MNVLLHVCCAPCASGTIPALRNEGINPVLYWYNPNIHPFREYEARLGALREYAERMSVPLIVDGDYGLKEFLAAAGDGGPSRCAVCYRLRLDATGAQAASQGFDAFTTTLLVSPSQNREAVLEAGRRAADSTGVPFLERDFRVGYTEGVEAARNSGLYIQKYCGCIFSEAERYSSRVARIKKGFFPNFPSPHKKTPKDAKRG